jgi:hypothetical protein
MCLRKKVIFLLVLLLFSLPLSCSAQQAGEVVLSSDEYNLLLTTISEQANLLIQLKLNSEMSQQDSERLQASLVSLQQRLASQQQRLEAMQKSQVILQTRAEKAEASLTSALDLTNKQDLSLKQLNKEVKAEQRKQVIENIMGGFGIPLIAKALK